MIGALVALSFCFQDPDLQAVLHDQAQRTAVVAHCSPSVCSVMDMESPGGGSGVVIDPHGFVLTNFHVVGQPDKDYKLPDPPEPPAEAVTKWRSEHPQAGDADVKLFIDGWKSDWKAEHLPLGLHHYKNKKVGLPDGELYEAEVLGVDPGSDLAILKLLPKHEGQTWPWSPLGDSDELLEGETVFAMGNPFLLATDFTPTVTFGVVSGTHRYQEGAGQRMLVYPDCIQVDAPVNPGNSGGPLFTESGHVVGINGRISIGDRGRVNVGVGFAIASNQIENFLPDLLAGRHPEHGTLDMSAWYMTAPHEESRRRGVFVQQVYRDSVVADAGVSLGDEITMFNGAEVRSANQLATMVGIMPAGAWVSLGFRPEAGDGYGPERKVMLRLATLDTGSQSESGKDSTRLASRADRRMAKAALLEAWHVAVPTETGTPALITGALSLVAADGRKQLAVRKGDALRIELAQARDSTSRAARRAT
jgi:S1-C subfamily serine protease